MAIRDVQALGFFEGTLTAAQIMAEGGIPLTTTGPASNPDAGKHWWEFDGTKSLLMSAAPFELDDDFAVVAAVKCVTSPYGGWNHIFTGGMAAHVNFAIDGIQGLLYGYWDSDGGGAAQINSLVDLRNAPAVVSMVKRGKDKLLRVNGVQVAIDHTVLSPASPFTTCQIGSYNGGDGFVGGLGIVLPIKGTMTDDQLLIEERYVASQFPNGPVF